MLKDGDLRCENCKYAAHQCMECALDQDQEKLDAMTKDKESKLSGPPEPRSFPPKRYIVSPWGECWEKSEEIIDDLYRAHGFDASGWQELVPLSEHEALVEEARINGMRFALSDGYPALEEISEYEARLPGKGVERPEDENGQG